MPVDRPSDILIAGAGIAGLTAALAFCARGFDVQLFERSPELREIGAGLQLSPNATRILDRLGVLGDLETVAVHPPAIVLRRARDLRELARVPLGQQAEARWGASYLVVHRADLQKALLEVVSRQETIRVETGATVLGMTAGADGVAVSVQTGNAMPGSGARTVPGRLVVGADGVWSGLRRALYRRGGDSHFAGHVAWRRTLAAEHPLAAGLSLGHSVNAFLHPGFHLVAYPVRAGAEVNLVAFTPGKTLPEDWSASTDPEPLRRALKHTAGPLAAVADGGAAWTAWPIHTAGANHPWINPHGLALIGDAAHAMTPFAAQGAAMAIEDADTLAAFVAARPDRLAEALADWEAARQPRIRRVAGRGAFNHFVWHAAGPVAAARDLVLRMRPADRLMADFDWLYGWKPPAP
ncbi:FAD-dependent monooxygenase [Mesorhizobium sp. LHD-90]|uniref:FAD-dependent monooxygenase n=1 Tax=Mesorhizobium sp. LHD-90 TaxID=3071414 RepID=UPI0027DEABDA|nr:FAD-dependent monooxygenase [Mesorhizobium sp. LHD-90]MDQ6434403.1 FAD-dependent monooxygenase [Mesorhizobium sp. LHD-90]